jgi:hypothetical protein
MLKASGPFRSPFNTSSAPSVTPTGVLVRNGVDTGVTVTISGSGTAWEASATIPADATESDWFLFRVTATISGTAYTYYLQAAKVENLQTLTAAYDAAKAAAAPGAAMALTSGERTTLAGVIEAGFLDDLTGGTFLAGIQGQIQAILDSNTDVPVVTIAAAVAAAVRSNLAAELARIDVATSSRAAPGAAMALTPSERVAIAETLQIPTAADNADATAAAILVTPANKLATDENGQVTATNGGGGGGSGTNYIVPLRSVAGERMIPGRIELFLQELLPSTINILDESGSPVNCTGKTANLLVKVGATVIKLQNLTPTGSPPHRYAFTPSSGMTAVPGGHEFTLERADGTKEVLSWGTFQVISCVREV